MSELSEYLGYCIREGEFAQKYVTDKIGSLRDGSREVEKVFEEARAIFRDMEKNK